MKKTSSKTLNRLRQKALECEEVLFAGTAMEMIEIAYGKRTESMKPKTLADMIETLCLCNGYEASEDEIIEAVNDYILGA